MALALSSRAASRKLRARQIMLSSARRRKNTRVQFIRTFAMKEKKHFHAWPNFCAMINKELTVIAFTEAGTAQIRHIFLLDLSLDSANRTFVVTLEVLPYKVRHFDVSSFPLV